MALIIMQVVFKLAQAVVYQVTTYCCALGGQSVIVGAVLNKT